jgi:succinate-semialdehyde dehydrogenase/glutarate-semialdehyde dehydrogenase
MAIQSINPATEEVLAEFAPFTDAQVDAALQQAHDAFLRWRKLSFTERGAGLRRAAERLRADKGRWARLITLEMGKPIVEAEAEIEKCAWACDYFAEHAERMLADMPVPTEAARSYVAFRPLGVVLAIMPWNFPFWQVFRAGVPALMAGNAVVLKHASNVPQCALAIEELLQQAELPTGLFRTVLVAGGETARLIADPRVRAVTLTGSSEVGAEVASLAGRHIKKQVLELGGSDPLIVLADADLDAAATTAARARYQNSGQSCICAKRLIVEETVADAFLERFAAAVRALRMGDPLERTTQIGPLARGDLRATLAQQVEASLRAGARAVVGGVPTNGRGYFYPPTVLDAVTPEMVAFREETFGPVAAVVRARDAEEALRLANATEYGLGASLWTRDLERAAELVRWIEAGVVFVNGLVASDPRLPFGGVKRSGYGRELGEFGLREFVNIQTVVMNTTDSTPVQGTRQPDR